MHIEFPKHHRTSFFEPLYHRGIGLGDVFCKEGGSCRRTDSTRLIKIFES
jgi:hypothetical protein